MTKPTMGLNGPLYATWRTAAVYIDCPTEGCGGGVEDPSSGSFMIDDLHTLRPGQTITCSECRQDFRLPRGPFTALATRRTS